jgi:UTP:GlnB (protein PII) uridylyltransferase
MLSRQKYAFQIHHEKQTAYHKILIDLPWRQVRYVLDQLRDIPVDIRKAHITSKHTTLYMKAPANQPLASSAKLQVYSSLLEGIDMESAIASDEDKSYSMRKITLPEDTTIMMYNVTGAPYTLLEFSCGDRIGLLNDLLDILASMPVDIETGIISSVGTQVHNVFYLCRQDKPLSEKDMAYVANVLEHDGRDKTSELQVPSD